MSVRRRPSGWGSAVRGRHATGSVREVVQARRRRAGGWATGGDGRQQAATGVTDLTDATDAARSTNPGRAIRGRTASGPRAADGRRPRLRPIVGLVDGGLRGAQTLGVGPDPGCWPLAAASAALAVGPSAPPGHGATAGTPAPVVAVTLGPSA